MLKRGAAKSPGRSVTRAETPVLVSLLHRPSAMRRICLIVFFLVTPGLATSCMAEGPTPSARVGAAATPPLIVLQPVVTGLDAPVAVTHAPSDPRLFITLQRGKIVIHDASRLLPVPFLDITPLVTCCGERGLLSVAFHPRYAENGLFYVNYTGDRGQTVIARYKVSQDPNRADPASAFKILEIEQPYSNHNGGQIQFGPDGFLYIGMGDGGAGGDPENRAQNLQSLLGKMLRIDVDAAAPYGIPSSNPFASGGSARREIWSYGVRNPWRFTFDRATGDLWMGDVGQNAWEEVNLQPASSQGGENYGWRRMEGAHCFNPATNCNDGTLVLPVLEYRHPEGCSITGGYRYRGGRFPRLKGIYFYGDYCSGIIWGAAETSDGRWTSSILLRSSANISTFGEDAAGEMYLADLARGIVYQITDSSTIVPRRRAARRE